MCKLGNIVIQGKNNDFADIFNVVDSIDRCIDGLPTLVIGWKYMSELYPDVNILVKEYNGIHWTFSKTERRCEYEEDIVDFNRIVLENVVYGLKYVYVDIINYGYEKIKKVIEFFTDNTRKTVFLTRNSGFMFVYSNKYNTVFGISLSLCEYIGIKKGKIIKHVRNASFIKDTSFITDCLRKFIGNNTHYILPLHDCLSQS